eukprot:406275-Alexandrium_andersonii.AAC.1
MRWTSACLWRLVHLNVWHFRGDLEDRRERAVRRMASDMHRWFVDQMVPQDRRIGDLSVKMLGWTSGASVEELNDGTIMKTKAAETGILM